MLPKIPYRELNPLWDGIELWFVALGAGNRQAEKSAGRGIHAIVLHFRAQRVKPGSGRLADRIAAICALTNLSYGMSLLNAWITQFR